MIRQSIATLALLTLVSACVSSPHQSAQRGQDAPGIPAAKPIPAQPVRLLNRGTVSGHADVAAVTAKYEVYRDPTDTRGIEVVRLSDHHVILRHRPADPAAYQTGFVGLAGDRLVVVDANLGDDGQPSLAYVDNLVTGKQTAVAGASSVAPVSSDGVQGAVDADGSWYYSSQRDSRSVNCVGELDLNTLREKMVECAPQGGVIPVINSGDGGATWIVDRKPPCHIGRGIRNGVLYTVDPGDCHINDTAWVGSTALWGDLASTNDGPPIALQAARANVAASFLAQSLVSCGGYAYWESAATAGVRDGSILRWRPGGSVQMVLARTASDSSPDVDAVFPVGCNDNILTITVWHSSPKEQTQVFAVAA